MDPAPTEGDKRPRDQRIRAVLPVDLGQAKGVTRDVSATGVFVETDAEFACGSTVRLDIELTTGSGKMILKCLGDIVRVETLDKRIGIAVKIVQSTLEPSGG